MIEEKIARVKALIEQREKIDAELAGLFGMAEQPKRGRPRKDQGNGTTVAPEQRLVPESTEPGGAGA